jgi:L-threonylcarbamoyladenylate synthase
MYDTAIGTDIEKAKALLEEGELVAIPTETVYGLAANGLSETAIARIYEAKNRPQFNPLILHVANLEQAERLVTEIPDACKSLMQALSPGPITYLLPKSSLVPDLITAGSSRVAIRIPNHAMTLDLLGRLDFPLAAPSANPSGYVSPVSADHVMQGLHGKIPYILDGGSCSVGLESTIVGFENDTVVIHRLGGITAEVISKITGVEVQTSLAHASPTAPGQLKSHYATSKPLLIGDVAQLINAFPGKKIGLLMFEQSAGLAVEKEILLSPTGSLGEAAAGLFRAMRLMDQYDLDVILAERFPDTGIGRAINDRLERAAFKGD